MGWTWILSTLLAQVLIDFFVNIYEDDVSNAEVSYWNHLLSFSNFQILRWEDGQELWALKLNTPPERTPHPSNQDHYFRILILIKINQKCRKYIDFFIVIIFSPVPYHVYIEVQVLSLSKTQPRFMQCFQFYLYFLVSLLG